MFREWTEYLKDRGARKRLLMSSRDGAKPDISIAMDPAHRELLQEVTASVEIPEDVVETALDIWEALEAQHGIKLSDRRWAQCLAAIKAHAVLEGRTVASSQDLLVLTRVMWNRHEERAAVYAAVTEYACPGLVRVAKIVDGVTERYAQADLKQPGVDHLAGVLAAIKLGQKELEKIADTGDLEGVDYEYQKACSKLDAMYNEVGRAIARNKKAYGMD
tara:strand:- start:8 stop:661 length:654 start_codon:yes stop_codon:yes gene_type:complete